MSGEGKNQHELPMRFEHKGKRPNPGVLKAVGLALVFLPVAVVVVSLVLLIDLGTVFFAVCFAALFIGITLLMKASHARSIADVTIDEQGLIIERPGETQEVLWSQLRWAEQNQSHGTFYLMLYGQDMKLIDRIPKSIDRFETLFELVNAQFEDRPAEDLVDAFGKRADGYMRWQLFIGIPLVLLGVAMIIMAQVMPQDIPRLNKDGVFGWGEVIEVYSEGSNRRLKYRVVVDDAEGPVEDVKMEPEAWDALREEVEYEVWPSVEVVYLAEDLSVSFAQGQEMPSSRYTPFALYTKAALAILLGGLMLKSAYAYNGGREKFAQALEQQRSKPADTDDDA